MSWLELDDQILAHPKFVRAVKLGGSEAVHLWLGLRAYCGQHLTDGLVPEDMLDEVRGPTNPKLRARALDALRTVGLVDAAEGGVKLHDYLDWSSSREEVLQRRESARDRKRRSRGSHAVTDAGLPAEAHLESQTPARAVSSPSPPPHQSSPEGESAPAREATAPTDDRETPCPPDLEQRLVSLGVVSEMAKALGASEADVQAALREFVSYWTIGGGTGKRRAQWPAKAREHIRRANDQGKLHGLAPLESGDPARAAAEAYVREQAKRRGEVLPPDEVERRVLHELDPATHAARRAVDRDRERERERQSQSEAEPDRATAAKQASAVEALIRGVG